MPDSRETPPSVPGITDTGGGDKSSLQDMIHQFAASQVQPDMGRELLDQAKKLLRRAVNTDPRLMAIIGPALQQLETGYASNESRGDVKPDSMPQAGGIIRMSRVSRSY